MSQDPSPIVSIDDLVKPGYHDRLVVEIDRRDPDLMSLVIISRTLIAHSIEVVDLADMPAKSQEPDVAGATNGGGSDNNNSCTEGDTTNTKTSNAARRKMNGDTDSGKKSRKRLCRKHTGCADWPQKEDKADGGVKARSNAMGRMIREACLEEHTSAVSAQDHEVARAGMMRLSQQWFGSSSEGYLVYDSKP
ncbi:hypothetical protein BDW75DRAFT_238989 [Aspergillus navahoensis]